VKQNLNRKNVLHHVYTDHSLLLFLNNIANNNQKLLRWPLYMQQYNLDVRHRPGSRQ